ncbi:hypothetical protein L207DRAFT_503376 [Hyaloscypha variabilis F]|uniref:Zn(2)-C6 fungal-type domain-containing protein n=1 Tax=Hyaloscypha variabilis (strain UAMH 11265 / GT02V1 / F) TaxID=1149755 RepID=A0A2J6QUE8_HYAVF|nr:hypothetical protein L207DRAFT_503376 [Hyaloscypha variabilis F]
MPRVAPNQRKRAYRPKTRTGCNTCKYVIKCDETIPSCAKCTSTGRKCDGYQIQAQQTPPEVSKAIIRSPNTGFFGNTRERRSFYFFQERTAPQLSGFFAGDFWERLLLQATHHEPCIRHAIIALGSLHERFEQDNGLVVQSDANGWTDDFALKNYNQAIKYLMEPLSRKAQTIDTMQSAYGPAVAHLQSGLKILCEAQPKIQDHPPLSLTVSAVPYAPIEMLEEIFMRLDLQVTQMVGTEGEWNTYEIMKKHAWTREIPPAFSTVSQARNCLLFHWHKLSFNIWDRSSKQFPEILIAWQKTSIAILDRWSTAFDAFLSNRGDKMTDNERKGAAVLTIIRELGSTSVMLVRTKVDDQRNWDIFSPIFEKIVCLAEDVVKLDFKSNGGRPTFCIDLAIVSPLFEVSIRCRDPVIRRRAINLLRTCGRTEGVWNAFLTSKVAQKVLDIEETGLTVVKTCEDIPDWARISNINVAFHPVGRKATLTYSRSESKDGVTRGTVEEVIEW